jgi:hypothetical protein
MSSLTEYREVWVRLVEKAFADYNSLTPAERTWFNVQSLMGAVENGGFASYYYNSPAERSRDTIEDLQNLGFPDIAALLIKINQLFPGGVPPADIDERNDVMETWDDEKADILEECDDKFFGYEDELEEALIENVIQKMPFYGNWN